MFTARPDGAPAVLSRDAVICVPSLEDSPGSLTKEHLPDVSYPYEPGDVGPRDKAVSPIFLPLQEDLRFFRHLTPYLQQRALRFACPELHPGRSHGVTPFRVFDDW